MNYAVLIIVAIAGIALGMYIARRNANAGFIAKPLDYARDKQMEQKAENTQKILSFVCSKPPTSKLSSSQFFTRRFVKMRVYL